MVLNLAILTRLMTPRCNTSGSKISTDNPEARLCKLAQSTKAAASGTSSPAATLDLTKISRICEMKSNIDEDVKEGVGVVRKLLKTIMKLEKF